MIPPVPCVPRTLKQSVLCQLSLLFPLRSPKKLIHGSKLVLNLLLFFSKDCCFNFFMPSWTTKHQWLVDNLLWQPHLYLPPLPDFLKWLECLEVGFREVVRGLVSPTPFMEDCGPSWHRNYHLILAAHRRIFHKKCSQKVSTKSVYKK